MYMATVENHIVGNESVLLNFFFLGGGGGGGGDSAKKGRLQISSEKMRIYSYVQVERILVPKMFPKGWADFKGLYSRVSFVCYVLATACLLTLGFFWSHYNSSVG
jgi:hypothetical protein